MKTVRFLGPARRLHIGDAVLERDGEPVRLTEEQFRTIEGAGDRWQYEVVDEAPRGTREPRTARKQAATSRTRNAEPAEPAQEEA